MAEPEASAVAVAKATPPNSSGVCVLHMKKILKVLGFLEKEKLYGIIQISLVITQ